MTLTKKIILLLVVDLILLAAMACAQTVSPVTAESGKGKARGFFTTKNNSTDAEVVTIVAQSFSTDKTGKPMFRPLDTDVHVRLAATSVKVGPQQSHMFDYDIDCPQGCAVVFEVTFMGKKTSDGLQLALHIPTAAYVCADKATGCRRRMRDLWGAKGL